MIKIHTKCQIYNKSKVCNKEFNAFKFGKGLVLFSLPFGPNTTTHLLDREAPNPPPPGLLENLFILQNTNNSRLKTMTSKFYLPPNSWNQKQSPPIKNFWRFFQSVPLIFCQSFTGPSFITLKLIYGFTFEVSLLVSLLSLLKFRIWVYHFLWSAAQINLRNLVIFLLQIFQHFHELWIALGN